MQLIQYRGGADTTSQVNGSAAITPRAGGTYRVATTTAAPAIATPEPRFSLRTAPGVVNSWRALAASNAYAMSTAGCTMHMATEISTMLTKFSVVRSTTVGSRARKNRMALGLPSVSRKLAMKARQ